MTNMLPFFINFVNNMLTYKRKLKLTKIQEERILSWIGVCRLVYNMGLEIKISSYKNKLEPVKQVVVFRNSNQREIINQSFLNQQD